jgi:phage-related protein
MFDDASGCYAPNWPVDIDREPRLSIAKFGDGYEQRNLDGINWMNTTWKCKWTMRPRDVLMTMDAYLTSMQAGAFPFFDQGTLTVVNVFCDKWTISWSYKGRADDYGSMDAEFRVANGDDIAGAGP